MFVVLNTNCNLYLQQIYKVKLIFANKKAINEPATSHQQTG
jgi:hypothetical protein